MFSRLDVILACDKRTDGQTAAPPVAETRENRTSRVTSLYFAAELE